LKPIEVVLADSHQLIRQGLRALLEAEPDISVVGEANSGLETCRLVEILKPHVLLVDFRMTDMNALEVTRQVVQGKTRTHVIILTTYDNQAYVLEGLRCGAAGYLVKDSTASDLFHAVREVAAGGRYLSETISRNAINAYLEKLKHTPQDDYETLTKREREVLHLVSQGHTNSQIAKQLSISRRTVEDHRARMKYKLGLKTQANLIRFAIEREINPREQR